MARIAVVGAGPAGSAAAWHLAVLGHEVTLIDRAAFPRPKTCGDWITAGAVAELARLGLTPREIERQAGQYAPITRTVLVAPGGRRTESAARGPAYCITRLIFDAMLWRHAVAAGCRPARRHVRQIAGDADLGRFDHVVDARGAHAGAPNAVALRAYWTVPFDRLAAGDHDAVRIHADALFRRGYGWLFPVSREADGIRVNLGVGLWAADNRPGHDVAGFFDRFLRTNPELRRWRDAAEPTRPVGCHVGLGLWRNRVADGDALRIGDAANLADPLTGDGIGNALKSGRLVAAAIHGSTDRSEAARRWQARHDAEFVPEFRTALAIRASLVGTAAKNLTARVLESAPAVRRRVHAAIFGEAPYRHLARPWAVPEGE
jgi:flavin-dependent dehydrogenase